MSYCGRRSGIELSVERVDIECDFDTRGVRGLADVERPFRCVCMSGKIKSDATAAELDRLRVAYRRACPVSRTFLAAGCEIKEDWVVG